MRFNRIIRISAVFLLLFFVILSSRPSSSLPVQVNNQDKIVIVGTTGLSAVSNSLDPALAYNSYSVDFSDPVFEGANYLDPTYTSGNLATQVMNLAYEGLVAYNGDNSDSFKGVLANNLTVSNNGSIFTFNLKHNVFYQDNTPFNAYTMKYSIDRLVITNHKIGPVQFLDKFILGASDLLPTTFLNLTLANNYLKAGGITALDEFTLQIKLSTPLFYQSFLSLLCYSIKAVSPYSVITHEPSTFMTAQENSSYGMISLQTLFPDMTNWTKLGLDSNHDPAYSGIIPQGDVYPNTWMDSHMIGTGPYKLINNTSDEMIFSKNTDWHESFTSDSPGQIIWINAGELELLHGSTDILNTFNIRDSLSYFVDNNGNSIVNGITPYFIPSLINLRLVFNMNDSLTTFIAPVSNISSTWNQSHIINDQLIRYSTNDSSFASVDNPFTSLKFREAFCYAFDYDSFINTVYTNLLAIRSEGVIPFGMDGYQSQLIANNISPSYNLTIAKNLFQDVGWRGNITLLQGSPYPNTGIRTIADYLLANAINSLNIGIIINSEVNYNLISSNYHDLVFDKEGWGASYNDPFTAVFPQLDSQGQSSIEFSQYANPIVDQLIHESEIETNNSIRLNLFKQIEETSAKDYPGINLANLNSIYLVNNTVNSVIQSKSFNPFNHDFNFQFSHISPLSIFTSSNSHSTELFSANIPQLNPIVFISIVIGGIIILSPISLTIIVEYRKYLKIKTHFSDGKYFSFFDFLKSRLAKKFKRDNAPNHLSEEIFELLDEIEKENFPEK